MTSPTLWSKQIWRASLALVLALGVGLVKPAQADAPMADPGVLSIQLQATWQDPTLLNKAWALPVAALYRAHLAYQRNQSFCGPASIANVAHSWGMPGDQGDVLVGTGVKTYLGYLPSGLTLDQLAGVARHRFTNQRVTVLRGLDLATFRQHLMLANEPGRRYVVNFSREPLFGKGGGHHSPIAGYLVAQDLVLVLDVNQSFGPWLVKPARLLAAMNTMDEDARSLRGLLLIEK